MGGLVSLCAGNRGGASERATLQRLIATANLLTRYVEGVERTANKCRNDARTYLSCGSKNLAIASLKKCKINLTHAERHAATITKFETMRLTIESLIVARESLAGLREGSEAMKRIQKQLEDAEAVHEAVERGIEDAVAQMTILADARGVEAAINGGVPFDDEELERELTELAELERDGGSNRQPAPVSLPSAPATDPTEPIAPVGHLMGPKIKGDLRPNKQLVAEA